MRWVTSFRAKNFSNYINSLKIVKEPSFMEALLRIS
jgi:hypothetical protein